MVHRLHRPQQRHSVRHSWNLLESVSVGGGREEEQIRTLASLALLAAFAFAAPTVSAQDPRIGTWTLVSAQSSLNPPNKLSIASQHGQVHVVMSGETHLDFTAPANGHASPVPGNPGFNQILLRRVDKKQVEVTELKDGAVAAVLHNKLSADGNELTITTSTKGHADQTTVWTRTGGTRVAGDALAGEWTQDPSKTRLRQMLTLKIEPDGSGGIRFSGDDSYTARLDGKPYNLRNSRNDTVSLQAVDPHTVDAIYRRDNQVTQKDSWVVSSDGQKMTLTSMGTWETGQTFTEKLVFKKQ